MDTLERGFGAPATELEKQIAQLGPWFHNLHLPDGTQTAPDHPLGDFPLFKWQRMEPHISDDLTGLTVLDIGCNAGFYCFELAKRGAKVLGIDCGERYLAQGRWAAQQMGMEQRVEFRQMQVYELHRLEQTFDIVLFLGVFYHLRYPLLGLDLAARKCKDVLFFQTMTLPQDTVLIHPQDIGIDERDQLNDPAWPKLAFIENKLQGDPTNWWVANRAAVEAMLRTCGFGLVRYIASEIWICRDPVIEAETELRAIFS